MKRLTAVLLLLLTLVTLDTAHRVRAQTPDCGDPRDHALYHLICRTNDLEQRIAVLEATNARLEQHIADVAWAKAGDRIALWQSESAAYRDRFLFDVIYTRFKVHVCRSGIPHNEAIPC